MLIMMSVNASKEVMGVMRWVWRNGSRRIEDMDEERLGIHGWKGVWN